jgi:hypothetical protein
MSVNQTDARIILDRILSIDPGVWAVSMIERNGNILVAKSKPSFKQTFGIVQDGEKYGGSLAVATLSLVNELKGIFGEAQTIIAIYNNCKLMLFNIPSYEILVGLALQRSFNCEDDNFIEKIKQLITAKVEAN